MDNMTTGESLRGWLTPGQLAARVCLSRSSVYRRIDDGTIPEDLVRYVGRRKILLAPEAVEAMCRVRPDDEAAVVATRIR